MTRLADLGPRISILGPSNSGKSTLAEAIARSRDLPATHLDRFRFRPGTDWDMRSDAEFQALHDDAIAGERWVIDGNYSTLMPQRLVRATGLILLDVSVATSLWRYARRSLFETKRIGGLDGDRDSIKWAMLRHIVVTSPGNRRRYAAMARGLEMPVIRLFSPRVLARFYREEGLTRPC
jgi:adenylate kinase family enzyme